MSGLCPTACAIVPRSSSAGSWSAASVMGAEMCLFPPADLDAEREGLTPRPVFSQDFRLLPVLCAIPVLTGPYHPRGYSVHRAPEPSRGAASWEKAGHCLPSCEGTEHMHRPLNGTPGTRLRRVPTPCSHRLLIEKH